MARQSFREFYYDDEDTQTFYENRERRKRKLNPREIERRLEEGDDFEDLEE